MESEALNLVDMFDSGLWVEAWPLLDISIEVAGRLNKSGMLTALSAGLLDFFIV